MAKSEPELLKLLNTRASWNLPPYQKPVVDQDFERKLNDAAAAYGRAHPCDPHARARVTLHMRQGYLLPSDVLDDARSRGGGGR